jgi:hypothetical protein
MTTTPGGPPLTNDLSLEDARTVTGAMLGAFTNYAGGLVVRWKFDEGDSVLLTFASEQVFDLRDQFETAIAHFEKHQVALEPIEPVEHLAPEDFEKANVGIRGWYAHMASDGILWRLDASDASRHVFVLRPLLVAAIHNALVAAIDQMMIIDLRRFGGMRWTAMTDELEKLPGYALRSQVTAFEFSVEIFRRNGSALTTHLHKGCGLLDDELVRWDRRFQIDTFLMDTIYLLFNFVGAAMALVEHTRGFYNRHYKPLGKIPDYQAEIERRFTGNGLVRFIQEMRNLMAHVGLVNLVHEKRFHGGNVIGRVVMKQDEALVWDGWTSVAREWLVAGPAEIDMLDVVTGYIGRVNEFHEWFAQAREREDWRDFQYAELFRRAILAKRGAEDIPALKRLLDLPTVAVVPMRDAVGAFLTAEQQFNLRGDEGDGPTWLRKALELVRESYYVPENLHDALIAHFSTASH